jgi:DNA-binding LacI/PurR family transcriptional regulator
VTTDDLKVGELATEHLLRLGHRRVGHLKGTVASTAALRFEGYKQALAKWGVAFDEQMVRECGFTEADGYRATREWLGSGFLPTAIFAANDPAAIGAMSAIAEAGLKIPDDVAIVGGGNIHYGDMLRVPLTTVAWSTSEMGQAAARLLVDMVEGKRGSKAQQVTVEPELVVRASCGATEAAFV